MRTGWFGCRTVELLIATLKCGAVPALDAIVSTSFFMVFHGERNGLSCGWVWQMPELFFRWLDLDLPKNEEAGRQQDWRAAAQVCAPPASRHTE